MRIRRDGTLRRSFCPVGWVAQSGEDLRYADLRFQISDSRFRVVFRLWRVCWVRFAEELDELLQSVFLFLV